MRFFSILAAALASLTVADASLLPRQSLPACAQSCLTPGVVPLGTCAQNDNNCLCTNATYVQNVLNCLTAACTSQADITTAVGFATGICAALGITTAPAGVTTAAPGEPKTSGAASATHTTAPATTSAPAATSTTKTGAAPASIGVNQPLVLFGAAAVAFGLTL